MGRRAVVLVVALLLAAVAAFAIFQYLQGIEEDIEAGSAKVLVFRAGQTLAEATSGDLVLQNEGNLYFLDEEDCKDLPGAPVCEPDQPPGGGTDAITAATEEGARAALRDALSGKLAAGPISQNQILTARQWVDPTVEIIPLRDYLEGDAQAITISPGAIQGVNGFVEPGDRINAIITLDIEFGLTALAEQEPDFGIPVEPTGDEEAPEDQVTVRYTRYVLQGLEVLAVGQDVVADPNAAPTVDVGAEGEAPAEGEGEVQEGQTQNSTVFTLRVSPEQAERLVFAQDAGSLYFTLVAEDFVEVATKGVTIETLFEGDLVEDIFGNN